ncbi:DMT family transporter [Flavobacterium sp. XGLA_31]|uniref:DMT family transporter n=1 Tax=Flavobacterium sp. XGLA_31 TaxID=3447666 RepID=UPI003F338771
MNWIILIFAGLFEVGFTTCLVKAKSSYDWECALWVTGFIVCLLLSMLLLFKANLSIPMGTAYVVWTGIGAVGTVLVGIILFNEPFEFLRMVFLGLIIVSVVGLKMVSD